MDRKSNVSVIAEIIRRNAPWIRDSNLSYSTAVTVAERSLKQAQRAGYEWDEARHHSEMAVLEAVCEAGPSIT